MRLIAHLVPVSLLGLAFVLGCSDGTGPAVATAPAFQAAARSGFAVNGDVSGAAGTIHLTGGGSFDPATASNTLGVATSVAAAGGFTCTTPFAQGPFTGCAAGQGVRWDTEQLLASSPFKCVGTESPKTATTDAHTAVLRAEFYRAGDGAQQSFTAAMFVADRDLDADIDGVQNVWIAGVGCGEAVVTFPSQGPIE